MFRNLVCAFQLSAFAAVVVAVSAVNLSGDLLAQEGISEYQDSENQNEAEDLKALQKDYQIAEQRLLKSRLKMKLGEMQPQRTWPSWEQGRKTKFEKIQPQGEVFSRSERRSSQKRILESDVRSGREDSSGYESMGIEVKNWSLIQIENLKHDLRAAEEDSDKKAIKKEIEGILIHEYDAFLLDNSLKLKGLQLRVQKLEADLKQRADMRDDLLELALSRITSDAAGIKGLDSTNEKIFSQDETNDPDHSASSQLSRLLSWKDFSEASKLLNKISADGSLEAIDAFHIARVAIRSNKEYGRLPNAIVAETIAVLDNAIKPGEHRPELLHLKANLQYIVGDLKEAIKTQTLAVSQPTAGLEKKQALLTHLKSLAKPANQETPKK